LRKIIVERAISASDPERGQGAGHADRAAGADRARRLRDQKVLVAPSPGELKPLEEGQWADSVPRLVQTKMVESFENAGFAHVGKAMDGFTPEVQLLLEIRSFDISLVAPPSARIEISAKWLGPDAKISAECSFSATAPATGVESSAAPAALNDAFQTVARDIVVWAQATM
jgi:phospholipid/cholesterol/gamma-HCH transport system substrate-binding protein